MGRANFNDLTETSERTMFSDRLFCKNCKTPIGKNDDSCGKCDRTFSYESKMRALAEQAQLRKEHERNKKYIPPKKFI